MTFWGEKRARFVSKIRGATTVINHYEGRGDIRGKNPGPGELRRGNSRTRSWARLRGGEGVRKSPFDEKQRRRKGRKLTGGGIHDEARGRDLEERGKRYFLNAGEDERREEVPTKKTTGKLEITALDKEKFGDCGTKKRINQKGETISLNEVQRVHKIASNTNRGCNYPRPIKGVL